MSEGYDKSDRVGYNQRKKEEEKKKGGWKARTEEGGIDIRSSYERTVRTGCTTSLRTRRSLPMTPRPPSVCTEGLDE